MPGDRNRSDDGLRCPISWGCGDCDICRLWTGVAISCRLCSGWCGMSSVIRRICGFRWRGTHWRGTFCRWETISNMPQILGIYLKWLFIFMESKGWIKLSDHSPRFLKLVKSPPCWLEWVGVRGRFIGLRCACEKFFFSRVLSRDLSLSR